jgi:hypothetical protein
MKKTKIKIIQETANFYNLNNRADNKISCRYYLDGKMCAVGRCLNNAENFDKYAETGFTTSIEDVYRGDIDFKKDYKGHSVYFWKDLQEFHDETANFTETGLSNKGKTKIDFLMDKWKYEEKNM